MERTPTIATLRRASLSDQLAEELREHIFTELQPGELLPSEKAISESYEVSKPVAREALRKLEGSGLIRVEMGRGAVVQDLGSQPLSRFFEWSLRTKDSLTHLMELRRAVEIGAAELAAKRRTEEDIATLNAIVERLYESAGKAKAFAQADTDFHIALAKATKNPTLEFIIESLREVLLVVTEIGLDDTTPWELAKQVHRNLAEAVEKGDPAAARRATEEHFVVSFQVLGLSTADLTD